MVAVVADSAMASTLDQIVSTRLEKLPLAELQRLLRDATKARAKQGGVRRLTLPEPAYQLLVKIVQDLSDGKAVATTPAAEVLTTQGAAAVLGVSRQFLVRLLDEGRIPFHRVGTHRRVYRNDLLAFRKERDHRRHEAIQKMARDAVKDGVYDVF